MLDRLGRAAVLGSLGRSAWFRLVNCVASSFLLGRGLLAMHVTIVSCVVTLREGSVLVTAIAMLNWHIALVAMSIRERRVLCYRRPWDLWGRPRWTEKGRCDIHDLPSLICDCRIVMQWLTGCWYIRKDLEVVKGSVWSVVGLEVVDTPSKGSCMRCVPGTFVQAHERVVGVKVLNVYSDERCVLAVADDILLEACAGVDEHGH